MRLVPILAAAAALAASPAEADELPVNAPAGRAGEAAAAIARQTGTSVIIADAAVAARPVPAIRGRFTAREAVERLARASRARPVRVGALGWRLVADATPTRPRPRLRQRPAPPPEAQAPGGGATDIVVLATKRDLRLRDYAGQVTIVRGADLALGGPGGTERIAERVASVTSTHLGSGRNKLFIRGIADSSFTGPTQSTVGEYFGDLRLSYSAPDPDLRLTDMASVEVLEGPQGTLYGAGSLGGIIRLVPNAPEPGVVTGWAAVGGSATQHGALGADASGMVNLPLAGSVATLRLVFDAESQGGYIDKPLLGLDTVNRARIYGGRAFARLDPGGGWTFDAIGIAQHTAGRDSQYADRAGPPLTRNASVREGFTANYLQGQLVANGEFGRVRVRSSTGIADQDLAERYDATPPGGDPRLFAQHNASRMIANETRLWQPMDGRLGWVLGLSYTNNRTRLTRAFENTAGLGRAATGVLNRIAESTLYGEASYRLHEGLIATAGGRLTRSALGGEGEDVAPMLALAGAATTAQRHETVFLPSASLTGTFLPAATIYLKYQQGFRPGGLAIDGDFVRRFRSDRTRTFEVGARHGSPGSGAFDLAASVSFTRWTDIQADYIDPRGLPTTANIGDGRLWTATLAGGVAVSPALRFDGGLSWNRSRIDQPTLAMLARTGQVPNIARLNARGGFDYRRPVGQGLDLTAQGWARYVGPSRLGVGPELGDRQGDYLDTGLTVRVGRERMGLTFGLTNLLDTRGNRFALGTPFEVGRDQVTPLRPRTLRLGLDAAF
jgi:outer membrane receptor protein involved in Fe transport